MNDSERTCSCCGKRLEGIPTDMAYRRPVHYFRVPEAERATRIYETDDFCVIDGEIFLIRGVLRIPLIDQPGRSFTWGVWAAVAREHFERYLELVDVIRCSAGLAPSMGGTRRVKPRPRAGLKREVTDQEN